MKWQIDPQHSSIEFGVKHMGIATVRGRFTDFDAQAELDEDGAPNAINATIRANSIDTGVADRDAHLRSPDFFDVDQFPTLDFRSTAIERVGENRYLVAGELTMRGATHPVSLELERTEEIADPFGNRRIAGTLSGKINRKTWGLTWNQVLEFGALLVGEDVKLTLDVQVVTPQAQTVAA